MVTTTARFSFFRRLRLCASNIFILIEIYVAHKKGNDQLLCKLRGVDNLHFLLFCLFFQLTFNILNVSASMFTFPNSQYDGLNAKISLILFSWTEMTSSESAAKNQFNSVTHTSTTPPIRSRNHRSQQSNFENDNSYDTENDGDELIQNPLDRGPYFDVVASKNVTALVGTTAYLNCCVRNLGNKTVSFANSSFVSLHSW